MNLCEDAILGCLAGGAIGDAMGGPYEGTAGPIRVERTDPAELALSDDTELTLATCEGIIAAGRPDPASIADAFVRWYRERRLVGLGASTLKALEDLNAGCHWALSGRKGEMAAGNGAAMRIAPLAFLLDPGRDEDRRTVRDVCRITHHNDEAYAGALAVIAAIRAGLVEPIDHARTLLPAIVRSLPDSRVRDTLNEMIAAGPTLSVAAAATRFGCSGFVAESVPLALLGADRLSDLGFATMLAELIAAGGDTDTIASMAGQIAGARLGWKGLPAEWKAHVPELDAIRSRAQQLAALVPGSW